MLHGAFNKLSLTAESCEKRLLARRVIADVIVAPMEGLSGSPTSRMPTHLYNSREIERPNVGHRHERLVLMPTICEHKEFHQEENYQRTLCNSKLLNTRRCTPNNHTKLLQRFEEDEGSEEERPLLSDYNTQAKEKSKPERSKIWRMPKKGVRIPVRIAWLPSTRCRARLRASVRVLSPFFLLRKMRDVYVRALNNVGAKVNHGAWHSVGARAM